MIHSKDNNDRIFFLTAKQTCLLSMPAKLTLVEAEVFDRQLSDILQTEPIPKKIILDFAKTNSIDSSGLVCLQRTMQAARQKEIELICWSLSPEIKKILSTAESALILKNKMGTEAIWTNDGDRTFHPSVHSKLKRLSDILGALVGLSVTGILFIPVAIAIKLDSQGPIFYTQIRCGLMGKRFRIWKFRSMVANADRLKEVVQNQASGAFFKNENDPRITKVGRFLRKTSLDEFPQFWNVLQGDMSLVGTRPPTLQEVEIYAIEHGQRLNIKPGLTGEWQVNGRSKILDFDEVVRLDVRYQKNWSLLYDFKLIIKTILVIFHKDSGAC